VNGGHGMLNFKEALNNSSMNSQSMKSEKCDFHFSLKINNLWLLILAALTYMEVGNAGFAGAKTCPCTTGTSELIRGSLKYDTGEFNMPGNRIPARIIHPRQVTLSTGLFWLADLYGIRFLFSEFGLFFLTINRWRIS